ncbi:YggT family protein [Parenemella sanctibonifatiensis]|uniref:YggT family protein n=1 Tax=Parenemella sanctibonifatiensis TaxID=2016505 RepID=A0A255EE73_9ACTN|nr:YggT family protein [Parenemella sanctibonifatiensis]OYN89839.1 YggT family protein [Parenemella sanctibonifatiensis]
MALLLIILFYTLQVYSWILMARVIMSWVPMFVPQFTPRGVLLVVFEAVYTVTDPPLKVLQKFIPPVRIGNIALDVAFLVLFVLVMVAMQGVVMLLQLV